MHLYPKITQTNDFDPGFKYLVSEYLSFNLSAAAHISLTDYLDDIRVSKSNDFYLTALAAISFSPFVNVDNDGDGCPDSSANSLLTKLIIDADEIFSGNSSKIKFDANEKLDKVTDILNEYPDLKWRIEGHMDSQGSEHFIRTIS